MKIRLTLMALSLMLIAGASAAAEVNVYSARKEALIKPLLTQFTETTGIKVNLVTGKADALLQRLQSEGANTPADLFITTDAGRLWRAREAGVLQAVQSDTLNDIVPVSYRDPEGYWYGLSLRARTLMYVTDKVDASELSDYESLADPKWKGRICIRSSSNIYNQSLVASMIAANGEEATEAWARGLVANLGKSPTGGDRDQIKAAAVGVCDVAVANTYYFGKMEKSSDSVQRESAAKMKVFWPNRSGRGTHVNVSGIGVTSAASHRDEAIRLIEFLLTDEAQSWYANVNYEYPVKEGVAWGETVTAWGVFKADQIDMAELGRNNAAAVRLMDRAGWR